MARFVRVRVVAHMGIGENPDEAEADMRDVADADNDRLQKGERNPSAAVAVLYDQDPGGGPCRPLKIAVGEVVIDLDVLQAAQAHNNDDDD